jgi:hypothetical protein
VPTLPCLPFVRDRLLICVCVQPDCRFPPDPRLAKLHDGQPTKHAAKNNSIRAEISLGIVLMLVSKSVRCGLHSTKTALLGEKLLEECILASRRAAEPHWYSFSFSSLPELGNEERNSSGIGKADQAEFHGCLLKESLSLELCRPQVNHFHIRSLNTRYLQILVLSSV